MENVRKKILLTGGTQGIGAATVHLLVEKGYEIHMTYRMSAKKAEEFCSKYPGQVFAYSLDQGDSEAIKDADFLVAHSWDGIIFNAALGSNTVKQYVNQSDSLGASEDEAMMKVNALGTLWIYKKVKDSLLKRREVSKLIFLSSVGGGFAAFPNFSISDGMSKAAICFIGRHLAVENTHTLLDVFVICPGATETPMFTSSILSKLSPEERAAYDLGQSKKRLIQPEEIAYWLCELLKKESTVLHGAIIDASMGLGSRPGIQTERKMSY